MDIHVFFQSIGQGIYNGLVNAGAWFAWLWSVIAEWFQGLPIPNAIKLFSNETMNRYLFFGIIIYLCIMNIWAFVLFGADKASAKRKDTRIRESKLFRICFWGGALGGMLGMNIFRHKTLKRKFAVGVPLLFILQLLADSFVLGFLGFWTFF